jgi:hypothetical protein
MDYTVNPELLALANRRVFEKSAVVPPQGGMGVDQSQQLGMAPPTPDAMGAQQPVDPAQAAAAAGGAPPAAPPGMMDPAMLGALPPATPTAPAPGAAGQKLKPEQMMQMLDYRLYNMQQQLTAIMNAMGVQVAPESLVLPPGTTGAPPAETALPGGPMAPPPAPEGAAGPQPPGGPMPPGGPLPPGAPPADPAAGKQANWWERVEAHAVSRVGRPVSPDIVTIDLQAKVGAAKALHRSLADDAR